MVKLNKIYTRTGDAGTTALGTGARLAKDHLRIAAYGTVDEANAAIGLVRRHIETSQLHVDHMLERIQNDLFDLGADLCVPPGAGAQEADGGDGALRISASQVVRLETEIDLLNDELEPLRSFVLPGGSAASAALHLARTISRRAERDMVSLAAVEGESVNDEALRYINRLSDFLFVAGRYCNDRGTGDVLWTPGANR